MFWRVARLMAPVLALVGAPSAAASQETLLTAGTELVYESGGTRTPWRVEAIERGITRGDRSGCLRVRFAPGGPRRDADERVTCEGDGTLFAWDSVAGRWRATRPLRPGTSLELRGATTVSRYSTGDARDELIGDVTVRVVETTVVTTDTLGTAVRRLRERYAPTLGTATWGVFEVPDPAVEGGWRVQVEFTLVEIRRPPRGP